MPKGNIVFRSLQLAPLKPTFNHLTANFADQDFAFVTNSVAVYDIDHATMIGGAGPMYLKSSVNLCGTSSKSQAARIVSTRLREELGGTSAAEWKAARQITFRTTVLALNTEPGMVCSMAHADMPGGSGEFRVLSWKLNKDVRPSSGLPTNYPVSAEVCDPVRRWNCESCPSRSFYIRRTRGLRTPLGSSTMAATITFGARRPTLTHREFRP